VNIWRVEKSNQVEKYLKKRLRNLHSRTQTVEYPVYRWHDIACKATRQRGGSTNLQRRILIEIDSIDLLSTKHSIKLPHCIATWGNFTTSRSNTQNRELTLSLTQNDGLMEHLPRVDRPRFDERKHSSSNHGDGRKRIQLRSRAPILPRLNLPHELHAGIFQSD
jgi:hypothetical protein